MQEEHKLLIVLPLVGAIIGIAKMLNSDEPLKVRQVFARAVLNGALGMGAGAVVLLVPGVGFVAQVAIACILASLGVSALEGLFQRLLRK